MTSMLVLSYHYSSGPQIDCDLTDESDYCCKPFGENQENKKPSGYLATKKKKKKLKLE